MKIIAWVPTRYNQPDVIVHMTADELAMISRGNPYASSCLGRDDLLVGTVIKVGDRFTRAGEIDCAQAKLDGAAESLRAVAALLGTINIVVPPVPEGTEVKP